MCLMITIETRGHKEMSKIWITYPRCGYKDWYYFLWIGKCDLRGDAFSNIRNIQTRFK